MIGQSVILFLALFVATASGACVSPGTETYDMWLPYSGHSMNVTVPPVPTTLSNYSYATDNAMVAIPKACVEEHGITFGLSSGNLNDRQPGGPTGMGYVRISNPAVEYAALANMQTCACGLVILMHGTSGVTWQTAAYSAMMSGMGYVVVMPDSQAMPDNMGLKGKRPLKTTAQIDTSNHCGSFNPYDGSCSSFSKPYCYSTKAENVVNDAAKYKEYVERNYLIRQQELEYFVQNRQDLLDAFSKIFLFGRSEGAMIASRFHNSVLDAKLSGRILSGYSCEFNYFVSCADNAKICGDQCSKSVPQLNVNGDIDSYFGGVSTSVSSSVAAHANGYGGPISGNCRKAYDDQGFTTAVVVDFPGVSHSIMYSHDNALRSVIADFLVNPAGPASLYASLDRSGCTFDNNIYACDAQVTDGPPCVSYEVNPNASWTHTAASETCPPIQAASWAIHEAAPTGMAVLAALLLAASL